MVNDDDGDDGDSVDISVDQQESENCEQQDHQEDGKTASKTKHCGEFIITTITITIAIIIVYHNNHYHQAVCVFLFLTLPRIGLLILEVDRITKFQHCMVRIDHNHGKYDIHII